MKYYALKEAHVSSVGLMDLVKIAQQGDAVELRSGLDELSMSLSEYWEESRAGGLHDQGPRSGPAISNI